MQAAAITREKFDDALSELKRHSVIACDTETTGLDPYGDSVLFSIVFYAEGAGYYFNFKEYPSLDAAFVLTSEHKQKLKTVFARPEVLWAFHNAKFDLVFLEKEGIEVKGQIHDTMAVARLVDSKIFGRGFSLDALGTKIGYPKDKKVARYIKENELFTVTFDEDGTKQVVEHHDRVPFELIVPYAIRDAEITYRLCKYQRGVLKTIVADAARRDIPEIDACYRNEIALTKTVYKMERTGVLVDKAYCKEARAWTKETMEKCALEFKALTGEHYIDSHVLFAEIFKDEPLRLGPVTETGKQNYVFDKEVLSTFKHPAAAAVLRYRAAHSLGNFFSNFLRHAGSDGVLHASFNQHIPVTGRFSSSNPNLQNLSRYRGDPGEDDMSALHYPVRRAIIPRYDMCFTMIDFEQVEYRLALDYAAATYAHEFSDGPVTGVMKLITMIKDGYDLHQAFADEARVPRDKAKNTNFGILYGQGKQASANALNLTIPEAEAIRAKIFNAAPQLESLIAKLKVSSRTHGHITNWLGRRIGVPSDKVYRAVNYMFQGGVADIIKVAMNRVTDFLEDKRTRLVLSIHDELVFEGPPSERGVLEECKTIMESVYPAAYLPLTCSVEHSLRSLADKKEGFA